MYRVNGVAETMRTHWDLYDAALSPEDRAIALEDRRRVADWVAAAVDGDPELAAYVDGVEGTRNRREVAAALGWPVARVSAARIKLQRRMNRRGTP